MSPRPTQQQLQATLDKYETAMQKVERLWEQMPDDPDIRKDIVDSAFDLAQLTPKINELKSDLHNSL